ncbi:MAG TPA: TolC family protein [Myxococcota bacterium]|nr:TolC family protein [Myxococcota bacterium]
MILVLLSLVFSAEPDHDLSYDEVRERVLMLGVDLRLAETARRQAELVHQQRRHAWDPDLGYSAELRASGSPDGISTLLGAGLDSTFPIYAGGSSRARLRQAAAAQQAADEDLRVERQQLLLSLSDSLLLLWEANAAVEVERSRVQSEQASLEQIQALVRAGARTQADQLQQEAVVAEAEAGLLAAQRDARSTELLLLTLLRLDPIQSWELHPPAESGPLQGDLAALSDRALRQRPELRAAQARVEQAVAAVEEEKAGLRPTLQGSLGVSGSVDPLQPSDVTGVATAALQLSGAILDRGNTTSGRGQAEQAQRAAELRLEEAQWQVRQDLADAISRRDAAVAILRASERQNQASVEALRLVEARYTAGAALYSELAAARLARVGAQRAVVGAQSEVYRAELRLRWAVGEDL